MSDEAVQRLIDTEAIRQLKARYILFLDSHSYDDLRALFAEDATIIGKNVPINALEGRSIGPTEFVNTVRSDLRDGLRFHILHSSIIDVTSESTARGLWSFSSSSLRGYYNEEYHLEPGGWRFSSIEMNVIIPHDPSRLEREAKGYAGVADSLSSLARSWGAALETA